MSILSTDIASVTNTPRMLFGVNNLARNSIEVHCPSSNTSNLLIVHLRSGSTAPNSLNPTNSTAELTPGSIFVAPWGVYDDIYVQSITGSQNIYAVECASPTAPQISLTNFASNSSTSNVSGTVVISNFPSVQPVTGSVSISNLLSTQPVSGSVTVLNLPTTQAVSGSITVSNLPTTQAVSGAVTVNAGTNLNTSLLAVESGGNLASLVTKISGGLPAALANGALKTTGVAVYTTFSTPSATQTVTGAITLTTNNGSALGASKLGILVANTGTSDGWVATTSGAYMWLVPAGSYNYIPVGNGVTLYATVVSGTAILTATEFGY